jgi:hypothetical protein
MEIVPRVFPTKKLFSEESRLSQQNTAKEICPHTISVLSPTVVLLNVFVYDWKIPCSIFSYIWDMCLDVTLRHLIQSNSRLQTHRRWKNSIWQVYSYTTILVRTTIGVPSGPGNIFNIVTKNIFNLYVVIFIQLLHTWSCWLTKDSFNGILFCFETNINYFRSLTIQCNIHFCIFKKILGCTLYMYVINSMRGTDKALCRFVTACTVYYLWRI